MKQKNLNIGRLTPPYDKKIGKTMTKFINRTAPLAFASVAMLLASCANDEFTGSNTTASENTAIGFNMQTSSQTRADDDAPTKLGNMFIVWGEKNETGGKKAEDANLVFKNYVVKYTASSANTTTSNTKGWEYVGIDHKSYNSNVSPNIGESAQTIKYWDDSATSYTFTAVSAKEDDITKGNVKITKNEGSTDESSTGTVYDKGYTIELGTGATPGSIYYADRNNITKGESGYDHKPVTMTFRNFQSKIRFGIYETVPGYKVAITGIKYKTDATTTVTHPTEGEDADKTFGVDGNFVIVGKSSTENSENTKYTVTYTSDNKAQVAIATGYNSQTYLNTGGTNWLSTSQTSPVGTTSSNPTWDNVTTTSGDDNQNTTTVNYTAILPNPSNATDMKLTVSYELYSEDTGEKITCTDRTAVVPAAYCQWKSNYAYTYIFKISDKSAELYPITFDAAVVTDEVGKQETITIVEEPSITTFGYDETSKKVITGKDEYETGNTIYASVVDATESGDGSKAVTLSVAENAANIALYTVTTDNATTYPITEASVANAIANSTVTTSKKITCTKVDIKTSGDDTPIIVTSVPAEDGTTRNLSALKWKPTEAKTYAVEYTKNDTKTYKIVKVVTAANGGE